MSEDEKQVNPDSSPGSESDHDAAVHIGDGENIELLDNEVYAAGKKAGVEISGGRFIRIVGGRISGGYPPTEKPNP